MDKEEIKMTEKLREMICLKCLLHFEIKETQIANVRCPKCDGAGVSIKNPYQIKTVM